MVESGGGSKDNITMVEDGVQARGQDGVSTEKKKNNVYTHTCGKTALYTSGGEDGDGGQQGLDVDDVILFVS